jgi:hypothetical protein
VITVTTENATEVAQATRGNLPGITGPSSVRRSGTCNKLATALVAAQAEMKNPPKDSVNPHYKSRYADLATVRDTVMPTLVKFKLAVLQLPSELDGHPALTTILMHESGEWVETTIGLRPVKNDPQAIGSALTYARRYALQALAGVAAEDDDDGNAASQPRGNQQQQKPAPVPAPQQQPPKGGDNLRRRAYHATAYAGARNHAEYQAARSAVVADVEKGDVLSANDIRELKKLDGETLARCPAPQTAKA